MQSHNGALSIRARKNLCAVAVVALVALSIGAAQAAEVFPRRKQHIWQGRLTRRRLSSAIREDPPRKRIWRSGVERRRERRYNRRNAGAARLLAEFRHTGPSSCNRAATMRAKVRVAAILKPMLPASKRPRPVAISRS